MTNIVAWPELVDFLGDAGEPFHIVIASANSAIYWLTSCPRLFFDGVVQDGNLNDPMRVFQLKVPLLGMYSFVYQNVQSSLGSIPIML